MWGTKVSAPWCRWPRSVSHLCGTQISVPSVEDPDQCSIMWGTLVSAQRCRWPRLAPLDVKIQVSVPLYRGRSSVSHHVRDLSYCSTILLKLCLITFQNELTLCLITVHNELKLCLITVHNELTLCLIIVHNELTFWVDENVCGMVLRWGGGGQSILSRFWM